MLYGEWNSCAGLFDRAPAAALAIHVREFLTDFRARLREFTELARDARELINDVLGSCVFHDGERTV
jgi:hypothetical protein